MKRLNDVIVGTGAKPVDLVFPSVSRRENEYRVGMSVGAYLFDDLETGHFGQAQIDNSEIDRVFAGEIQAFLAVSGLFDSETTFRQFPDE
jgi:hypothetical protein